MVFNPERRLDYMKGRV